MFYVILEKYQKQSMDVKYFPQDFKHCFMSLDAQSLAKAVKIIFLAHSFDHILPFLKPLRLLVTFCIKFKLFSVFLGLPSALVYNAFPNFPWSNVHELESLSFPQLFILKCN
jgi:hypothetical protein